MTQLKQAADTFKALSHPGRLVIVNLTWAQERHGDELAAILKLSPATVSHHLSALTGASLLSARRDGPYVLYSANRDAFSASLSHLVLLRKDTPPPGEDLYRDKILRSYLKDGRLTTIPAQRKKRDVILAWLAEHFEHRRDYSEREVSTKIAEFHDDFFTLRRELVGAGLMTRANGVYRRAAPASLEAGSLD